MTQILIVEDDTKIAHLLKRFLNSENFDAEIIEDGRRAVDFIRQHNPALVLLDLMLPGMDGIDVCKTIRPAYQGPILMLTASGEEAHELMALNTGIDDFVSKPVRLPILLARINALLRRTGGNSEPDQITIQDLVLNKGSRAVKRQDQILPLNESEFELLWLLALQEGEVVSREFLFQQLLGREYDGLDRSIDMKISNLRKKLDDTESPPRYIRTLRNRGYILV